MSYYLETSKRKGKRYSITTPQGTQIHFGSDIGKTFIDHGDETVKKNWIARHKTNKNFNNMSSGIFWSNNLLWNKPSLVESIKDVEKRFNIRIKL